MTMLIKGEIKASYDLILTIKLSTINKTHTKVTAFKDEVCFLFFVKEKLKSDMTKGKANS